MPAATPTTPNGWLSKFEIGIRASMDREESKKVSDRMRDVRAREAREGKPRISGRPYGYSCAGLHASDCEVAGCRHDGTMSLVPAELEVIEEVVERVLLGESPWRIANDFNDRGIPSARGGEWRTGTLTRLLTNPRYVLREHKGVVVAEGQWERAIDRSTWDRLREALKKRPTAGPKRFGARTYPLVGFLFCSKCGGKLRSLRKHNGRRAYYCREGAGLGGCGGISTIAEPVEDEVRHYVIGKHDGVLAVVVFEEPVLGDARPDTIGVLADGQPAGPVESHERPVHVAVAQRKGCDRLRRDLEATVLGELRRPKPTSEGGEHATGLNLGELLVITNEDELRSDTGRGDQETVKVTRPDHSRFIEQDHVPIRERPALAEVFEERRDRLRRDTRSGLQAGRGPTSERDANRPETCADPRLPRCVEGERLTRAGMTDQHRHRVLGRRDRANRLGPLAADRRPGRDRGVDDLARNGRGRGACRSPGKGVGLEREHLGCGPPPRRDLDCVGTGQELVRPRTDLLVREPLRRCLGHGLEDTKPIEGRVPFGQMPADGHVAGWDGLQPPSLHRLRSNPIAFACSRHADRSTSSDTGSGFAGRVSNVAIWAPCAVRTPCSIIAASIATRRRLNLLRIGFGMPTTSPIPGLPDGSKATLSRWATSWRRTDW